MLKERKPNRLHDYDYSSDNLYFITSCVENGICCFGEIIKIAESGCDHHRMSLNDYGKIAERQWYWLAEQYRYTVLHAFVVMPNHIHGIIEIARRTSLDSQIKIKSLSELIGAYKTTVSKQIHEAGYKEFVWQRSFHDVIINNEKSYENIREYIHKNPMNWEQDNYYKS
jgi:REP element-mobilizing transposase RayT